MRGVGVAKLDPWYKEYILDLANVKELVVCNAGEGWSVAWWGWRGLEVDYAADLAAWVI